jgi:CRP/FNR family nitrogen fixation transcriptional regulator
MKFQSAAVRSNRGRDRANLHKAVEFAPDLALPGLTMSFRANEEIFGEEEPADFVYAVISGAARTSRLLNGGRRQIGAFHLPGDVFGLQRGAARRFTAEAIVPSEIAQVRRTTLEQAAERDSTAARRLWSLTAHELERLQDHMFLLGSKSATERVGSFLLRLAARTSSAIVDLPMSRSDIADHLGLTLETVSRAMTQLVRDQVIALPSARRVVVRDLGALAA